MAFSPNAETVFADGPSSSPRQPPKDEIRALLKQYEAIIEAFTSNGGLIYTSKSSMDADLAHAAKSSAWVVGDATVANNGIYQKQGGSGSGSWTRVANLPYSFIIASDAGAGTANAIQATTSLPVSSSAFVWVNIFETNTSSPVTVSFNGGSALTIKAFDAADIIAGGLTAGMVIGGFVSGSTFRMISDQSRVVLIAAINASVAAAETAQEAAEDAQDAAEDARDIAAGYASDAVSQGNVPIYATMAGMPAIEVPVGINCIRVNGRNSADDGEGGLFVDTDSGSSDSFTSGDSRTWYRSDRVFPLVAAPALRSTAERFWDKPSVRDWSARGNGSTHDDAAFQSAAAYSANNNFGMYVPRGIYLLEEGETIETTKRLSIYGDGGDDGSRIIARNFNTSLFRYKTVGTEMSYFRVTNLRIDFDYTDVANPSADSVAFEFGGDANFIQEATFDNLIIRGPRHAFKSTKPSHTTAFGEEGTVARMFYHSIQLADWTRQMEVGFAFPAGSGTANSWHAIRTSMGNPIGWVWKFEGNGCVVGDIDISGVNLVGPTNGFFGGDNTVYRRNFRIAGQFDAAMTNPVMLSATGATQWCDYDLSDVRWGGGTNLNQLPVSHSSRYVGNEVSHLQDGKRIVTNATGAQTITVYRVHLDQYTGCSLKFIVTGEVAGVGGGVAELNAIASRQNGVPTVVGINQTRSPDLAGYPQLGVSTSGDYVQFGITFTPTGPNTKLNAQVLVNGGVTRIEQL